MMVLPYLTIALATYLLSKLLTRHGGPFGVLDVWRDWLIGRSQQDTRLRPLFETLVGIFTCQFCMSFYMVVFVGLLYLYVPFLVYWLAILGIVSLFQTYDPGE